MQSTSIFRMGAVALSVSALAFAVWSAAAPGCTTTEQVRPESTSADQAEKTPPAASEQGKGKAGPESETPAAAAPTVDAAPSNVPPRFMGASKAAAPFDEDHLPGKKGGASPKQEPQVAPAQKGGQ
jgi:hypothetical protein